MTKEPMPAATNHDPLGYADYAATLWARIEQALDKDDPGDDPLVIGIFGEWGTGKSKLLELIRQEADERGGQTEAKRAQEFFAAQAPRLTLTVPVWFHPWKYEHEPNLAVPLLMHLADALGKQWKSARCGAEVFDDWLKEEKKRLGKAVERADELRDKFVATMTAVEALVSADLTATILGMAAGFMTGGVIGRDVIDKGLGFLKETLSGLLPESTHDKKKTSFAWFKTKDAKQEDRLPDFKADGKFYYQAHEQLRKITRLKAGTPVPGGEGAEVKVDVHINFVVFIDDLDRCLPENAVAVLELIKTLLNVESFAFVVALDDEVIERGIAHRYKDYRFENKKPDMPITGYEYLEKIVHLPFRLPQLTREQAIEFLRYTEDRLCRQPGDRHWLFPPASAPGRREMAALGEEFSGGKMAEDAVEVDRAKPSLLVELILGSMDSYVPRKMIRAVELLVQYTRLAPLRHVELADAPPWSESRLDVRVVMTLIVLQLFQPELFRFMRRRIQALPVVVEAFGGGTDGFAQPEPADVALYSWAGRGNTLSKPPVTGDPAEWAKRIEQLDDDKRHGTEQIRLPLVELLREHRQAQRHVFNPLRTFWQLAQARKGEQALVMAPYLSFIGKPSEPVDAAAISASATPPRRAQRQLRADIPVETLYLGLIAADASEQANLPGSVELTDGQALLPEIHRALGEKLKQWLEKATDAEQPEYRRRLLRGLAVIARWLDWDAIEADSAWVAILAEVFAEPSFAEVSGDLARFRATEAETVSAVAAVLDDAREHWRWYFGNEQLDAKQRVEAGDWLGQLGDPRFDAKSLFLPQRQDEPHHLPPGFVLVSGKQPFVLGRKPGEYPELDKNSRYADELDHYDPACDAIAYDYWMSRYPVTVAQWAVFMADGGYDTDALWLPQGIVWREGSYDSTVEDENYKNWLKARTPALRRMPREWSGQQAFANRPVVGVCWFEAMAYVRWLHGKLTGRGWVPAGYEVRLPTEAEWEKAARIGHGGMVPWGMGPADASHANIDKAIGHASAVGAYPSGRSMLGIEDLVGNVWEWTGSLYDNKFKPGAFREERALKEGEYPVIRGGSWYSDVDFARGAARSRNHPGGGDDDDDGLRVVLSLANSEY